MSRSIERVPYSELEYRMGQYAGCWVIDDITHKRQYRAGRIVEQYGLMGIQDSYTGIRYLMFPGEEVLLRDRDHQLTRVKLID